MLTIGLALLSSVFFGLSDFIGGTLSRSVSAFRVLLVAQVVATIALLPSGVSAVSQQIPLDALLWGITAGVANAIALSALYTALARGTMGVVAPISAASVVVPVLAGLLAGETVGIVAGLGLAVLIVGTVLAAGPEGSGRQGSRDGRTAVILSVVAAVAFGLAILALARGSAASVPGTLLISNAVSCALFIGIALVRRTRLVLRGRILIGAIAVGLLSVGANWLFATASSFGEIVVVSVLASLYPVVTVLLARQIHHERLKPVQWWGVAAVFAGIAAVVAS